MSNWPAWGHILVDGVCEGALYGIIASAIALSERVCKGINIALLGIMLCAAYLCWFFSGRFGVLGAGVLAVGLVAVLGAAFDRLIISPLRLCHRADYRILVISLALYIGLQATVVLVFGSETQLLRRGGGGIVRENTSLPIADSQTVAAAAALLCLGSLCVVKRSAFGRGLRAVSTDSQLARIVGLQVTHLSSAAAAISAVLAGVAGVVHGYDVDLTPTLGFQPFVLSLIAAALGRMSPFGSAFAAGLAVGVSHQCVASVVAGPTKDALVSVVLVVIVARSAARTFGEDA